MKAIGMYGSIEFDGGWVVIRKRPSGLRSVVTREIALTDISSVTYRRASLFNNGFFQITLAGTPAAPMKRRGARTGRPDQHDLDSVSFRRSHNPEFDALDEAIRTARRAATQIKPPGIAGHQAKLPAPAEDIRAVLAVLDGQDLGEAQKRRRPGCR
jgi:hypothetical protein